MVRLPEDAALRKIAARAILIQNIYELWGSGSTYSELHDSVRLLASTEASKYRDVSFKFKYDSFRGSKPLAVQRDCINSFAWLDFQGPIELVNPEQTFVIFEEYPRHEAASRINVQVESIEPERLFLGRLIGGSGRDLINAYTLKKRKYISTTSMDAEVALVMANMVQARPGALFFDPFVGTGSLTVACAHFGAIMFGSDIDPRTIRGKDGLSLKTNYKQYGTSGQDLGAVISDLVNTPLRGWHSVSQDSAQNGEWLDGIIADPPYGVREGLKTLGRRNDPEKKIHYSDKGLASHL